MPRGDAKIEKAFANDRSYIPSQASQQNGIGHAGDADEVSQVISELESFVRSSADRKAAIEVAFGSMDKALAYVLATPEFRKRLEDEMRRTRKSGTAVKTGCGGNLIASLLRLAISPGG